MLNKKSKFSLWEKRLKTNCFEAVKINKQKNMSKHYEKLSAADFCYKNQENVFSMSENLEKQFIKICTLMSIYKLYLYCWIQEITIKS